MLTAAQREKCRSLAQALDRGDHAAYKRAEPSLTSEEKGEIWDAREHVVQATRGGDRKSTSAIAELDPKGNAVDLDYWGDDTGPTDDDDPDDDGEPCAACNGTGRDAAGNECAACNGSGKVVDDEDDDEREDE